MVATPSATTTLTSCPTTGDCNRLADDLPKKRLDVGAHAGTSHRRECVDDLPPVVGLAESRIEHRDDAAIGRVADQSAGCLGEQDRGSGQVDLAERCSAEQLAAGTSAEGRPGAETGCGRW